MAPAKESNAWKEITEERFGDIFDTNTPNIFGPNLVMFGEPDDHDRLQTVIKVEGKYYEAVKPQSVTMEEFKKEIKEQFNL